MRVAILTHNAPFGDAIGNQVAEKVAFFRERGADVRVFAESSRRLHPDVAGHCRQLDAPVGEGWQFLADADLVIVEYGQSYHLLQLLPLLTGRRGRIVLDYHGVTPPALWKEAADLLDASVRDRGLAWFADAVLAHSRFAEDELRQQTGYPRQRTFTLGYPLDTAFWSPGKPEEDLRRQLGLGQTATLLLFVGRLAPNKRLPILIEALARSSSKGQGARGESTRRQGARNETSSSLAAHLSALSDWHVVAIGDSGDRYAVEAERCRQLAEARGVADRLHLLGHVPRLRLRDAYRSADLFVMPSVHEGFCLPVVEAMACGLPVVAARAAALPETVGPAGLTFTPDDFDDLVGKISRVVQDERRAETARAPWATRSLTVAAREDAFTIRHSAFSIRHSRKRIAVVAGRFGDDFAGGAETSLRSIAEALHAAGCEVEIFSTCARGESGNDDYYAEGTSSHAGIAVHRFRPDRHDPIEAGRIRDFVAESAGLVSAAMEEKYLDHTLRSARLLEALERRRDTFDAMVVGPYLIGLARDVARAFPQKTLLLACVHDEPAARLEVWRKTYADVAGILYHTPEEQELGEAVLGWNHPGARVIGTFVDIARRGDAERGRARVADGPPTLQKGRMKEGGRYVVYCGRLVPQKGLPALLDSARAYAERHPGRFRFVFMGEGSVPIPRESWTRDLGFVSESVKRDVLAGAAALVQPSAHESLSLTALEAWTQGVPVIASGDCAVLRGQLERSEGGLAGDLSTALDDLWQRPDHWRQLGQNGREFVARSYGDRDRFAAMILSALEDGARPLAERMRRRGRERGERFAASAWRERFAEVIEQALDLPPRMNRLELEIVPRGDSRSVPAGADRALAPVRLINRGTQPLLAGGPARIVVHAEALDADGGVRGTIETPLPGLLMPGESRPTVVALPVCDRDGVHRVRLQARPAEPASELVLAAAPAEVRLSVGGTADASACASMLDAVQKLLAEADRLRRLPDDYVDVSEGWFAAAKRWLKRKLLGNFKLAYVDVLSRQQSQFTHKVLVALAELAECCANLEQITDCGFRNAKLTCKEVRFQIRDPKSETKMPHSLAES